MTDAEAMDLLRVSTLQSIHNARAYCRNFDRLTASQQMAISQLVYQMGVNLEEFTQFLTLLNNETPITEDVSLSNLNSVNQTEHWKAVQLSLIHSQWARRYRTRAISVIAMFDPDYAENSNAAEKQVKAVLYPTRKRHRKNAKVAAAQSANHIDSAQGSRRLARYCGQNIRNLRKAKTEESVLLAKLAEWTLN